MSSVGRSSSPRPSTSTSSTARRRRRSSAERRRERSPWDAGAGRARGRGLSQALRWHRGRRRPRHARCARARSPRSSARTAPARPRCSTCSPAFIPPDRGSVQLNGEELVGLHARRRRPPAAWCARSRTCACSSGSSCLQNVAHGGAGPARGEPARRCSSAGRADAPSEAATGQGHGLARASSAWPTSPTCPPARCRTASRSWSRWPGCWPPRPRCSCSTSRPVGHRHRVGRHDARPDRVAARAGPHDLHRRAQPARGRPAGRPHLLHGARPDHRRGHDRRAHRARHGWRRRTLAPPERDAAARQPAPARLDAHARVEQPARRLRPQAGRLRRRASTSAPARSSTLLGHNGSGKTHHDQDRPRPLPGRMAGRSSTTGATSPGPASAANVKAGMALIPSERFVFPDLTVIDNLLLGGATSRTRQAEERLERVLRPVPDPARSAAAQLAGTMSGGQQRMLSLGLLLMAGPRLLMLDEPSLGLAPAVVQQIFDRVRRSPPRRGSRCCCSSRTSARRCGSPTGST